MKPFRPTSRDRSKTVGAVIMLVAFFSLTVLGYRQYILDSTLIESVKHNDAAEIDRLLLSGANPNAKDIATTPLSLSLLLRRWKHRLSSQNAQDHKDWQTSALPLLLTTRGLPGSQSNDVLPAVRILLAHGADVNASNDVGDSPLMIALADGNKPVVRCLLEHGADVNLHNIYGGTALGWYANTDDVEILLKYKANINAADNDGCTALIMAVDRGDTDTARILLHHMANKHIRDKSGRTALSIATVEHEGLLIPLLK